MNKRYTLAEIKAVDTAEDGTFEATLSAPTLDRDGEIIDSRAFDPLPDHITIDVDHSMQVEKTVASGEPFYDGDVLKFRGRFAATPLAQLVYSLVKDRHIRTMSVAYMGTTYAEKSEDGLPHVVKAELLNAGIVAVASNRDALIGAVKSLAEDVPGVEVHDSPNPPLVFDFTTGTTTACGVIVDAKATVFDDPDLAATTKAPSGPTAGDLVASAVTRAAAQAAAVTVLR